MRHLKMATALVLLAVLTAACGESGANQEDIDRAVAAALASRSPSDRPSPLTSRSPSPSPSPSDEVDEAQRVLDDAAAASSDALSALTPLRQAFHTLNVGGLEYEFKLETFPATNFADTPCANPPFSPSVTAVPLRVSWRNPSSSRTLPAQVFRMDIANFSPEVFPNGPPRGTFPDANAVDGQCNQNGMFSDLAPGQTDVFVGAFNGVEPKLIAAGIRLTVDDSSFFDLPLPLI